MFTKSRVCRDTIFLYFISSTTLSYIFTIMFYFIVNKLLNLLTILSYLVLPITHQTHPYIHSQLIELYLYPLLNKFGYFLTCFRTLFIPRVHLSSTKFFLRNYWDNKSLEMHSNVLTKLTHFSTSRKTKNYNNLQIAYISHIGVL